MYSSFDFSRGEGTLDTCTGCEKQRSFRTAGDKGKLKHSELLPKPLWFHSTPTPPFLRICFFFFLRAVFPIFGIPGSLGVSVPAAPGVGGPLRQRSQHSPSTSESAACSWKYYSAIIFIKLCAGVVLFLLTPTQVFFSF